MSDDTAILRVGDEDDYDLGFVAATEGAPGLDITKLRADRHVATFDPGFANTAGTISSISFINGGKGVLRHRGYSIEQLATQCDFLEVAYLLIYGDLPNTEQLQEWRTKIMRHTLLNEEMKRFFDAFPPSAHPMAILSSATSAISTFYERYRRKGDYRSNGDELAITETAIRLIAKMPTIAAFAYKKSIGQPYIYPRNDLDYVGNFLHMMFAIPAEQMKLDPVLTRALNLLFILHADHGQNCSTATVRFVGSSRANMFACVAAGMNALWGPLHGGANQAVIEMLEDIHHDPDSDVETYIARAKDKKDQFRLMGFGHRVYKNYDPRAKILKELLPEVLNEFHTDDPLLDIARRLEEVALSDDYFIERNLYPNIDFYSGILFRILGFPTKMFTALFAIGRLPGWIANWKEMTEDPQTRISRPRAIYIGEPARDVVALDQR